MRRWIKRALLSLLLVLVAIAGGIAWFGSGTLISPDRRLLQDYQRKILAEPRHYGLMKPISFTGPRGAPCQIYLPHPKPGRAHKARALREELRRRGTPPEAWGKTRGTLLLLHGRNGRKEDHLPIAERFCAGGFACIVWDLPGHGESPCPHATFGADECGEIPAVIKAARNTHPLPGPVGLFGISQGGAIALQAMAQDCNCYAVASVSAFAELEPLLEKAASHLKLVSPPLSGPAADLVRLGTRIRAGFDPADIQPSKAAQSIKKPVLIVHGELDTYIALHDAHAIFEAIPHEQKALRLVPDGSHGDILAKGGTSLYADLVQFFLASLPPDS